MIKFSGDELTDVFRFIDEYLHWLSKNVYKKITLEDTFKFNYYDDEYYNEETKELLKKLVDYEVKVETDEDHRNDGQLVDYTFYFKSPTGKISIINTEMCLEVGWNHWKDEVIE